MGHGSCVVCRVLCVMCRVSCGAVQDGGGHAHPTQGDAGCGLAGEDRVADK
jgi:hypothetical protein